MGRRAPKHVTAKEKLRTRSLIVISLFIMLIAAGFLVYAHSINVHKWFSFNERVVPGYNLWMSVSGVPCSVFLKPWGDGLLGFNITENLGWGVSAVVPEVADLSNGSTVSVNLTAGGSGLPFFVYTITVDIYTPAVLGGNLSFNLQSCSFKATDLDARGVYVYVGLGDVYVNLTSPLNHAAYSVVTQTGDILMALPAGQGFAVNATTVNGEIHIKGANLATLIHNNQNVYGIVGGGGPHIYLASVDGSITIETYPQNS